MFSLEIGLNHITGQKQVLVDGQGSLPESKRISWVSLYEVQNNPSEVPAGESSAHVFPFFAAISPILGDTLSV